MALVPNPKYKYHKYQYSVTSGTDVGLGFLFVNEVAMENPFTIPMAVRFRDIDAMGHVNNTVYATYLEQVRAEYYRQVIHTPLDKVATVLVNLEIDYRQPIHLGDDVTVAMCVTDLGESSIVMGYELRANGEVGATAETVQVVIDDETERSVPIPDEWRERIEQDREQRA